MKNYQFYHIYPLGMLNQLAQDKGPKHTLSYIENFLPHLKSMNINALYLGPVFESEYHGYDVIDYFKVDRRLGSKEELAHLIQACHDSGISVLLDCVFNHVSRSHFAFKDVLMNKESSQYKDWFYVDFSRNNHRNDEFSYETWDGHDSLVKLNLTNNQVKDHLLAAIDFWLDAFHIDGLRLDAADVMDRHFLKELNEHCKSRNTDFYIVGEMVHGDYKGFLDETGIDSVTNYECYKGLYSSLNDKNYFEIGYALNRLFSNNGLLSDYSLYNFVDNHDVNRVASILQNDAHLYPLYIMLYTTKGYPSLYYKSELGEKGMRTAHSDKELRRPFYINTLYEQENNSLLKTIQKLSTIRRQNPVLAHGTYEEVILNHQLIAYRCTKDNNQITVIINSHDHPQSIPSLLNNQEGYDLLNDEKIEPGRPLTIHPNWGRIIIN